MNRFFFAIYPEQSTKNAIVSCREQKKLSGRMIKASNLHLTLLFLGKLNVNQQQKIISLAEQIICTGFELVLKQIAYFKKSQVVWLGPELIPEALFLLHQELLSAANHCDIAIQQQSYQPHMTLARKSAFVQTQLISPIIWPVQEFVLFESIDTNNGVDYQMIQKFSCGAEI